MNDKMIRSIADHIMANHEDRELLDMCDMFAEINLGEFIFSECEKMGFTMDQMTITQICQIIENEAFIDIERKNAKEIFGDRFESEEDFEEFFSFD